VNLFTGWLTTLALLIISYLYGGWQLQNLKGRSVVEFNAGA
jgi:hypothetical protein